MPVYAHEAAQAVSAEVKKRNGKQQERIPAKLLQAGADYHIFNVSDERYQVSLGSLGEFTVHACEPGKPYSNPTIVPFMVVEGIAVDMDRIENRLWDGRDVVDDILGVGPFKQEQHALTHVGVFLAHGEKPTAKELEDAHAKWTAKQLSLVKEGDSLALEGDLKSITSRHRKAAIATNQEREWCKAPRANVNCPGCGDPVPTGIVIHGGRNGCGWIFDKERAIAGGLIAPAVVEEPKVEKRARA